MHIDKFFDDRYAKAGHLDGLDRTVTILKVERETVGTAEDIRPVIYFTDHGVKPMVCNKTNAGRIMEMYGPDADAWAGRQITLYPSETDFGGKTVPCIRVRPGQTSLPAVATPQTQGDSMAAQVPLQATTSQLSAYLHQVQESVTRRDLAQLEAAIYDPGSQLLPAELVEVEKAISERRQMLFAAQ